MPTVNNLENRDLLHREVSTGVAVIAIVGVVLLAVLILGYWYYQSLQMSQPSIPSILNLTEAPISSTQDLEKEESKLDGVDIDKDLASQLDTLSSEAGF